ncbi:hypothetical protein SynBIOSU31_01823 [Synechococcus sp. BIOS-U3-1]|nr:hypothetical protein SynBIOSU31_01823 [Synechococcus sp. BIOS-U3-1]
MWLLQRCSAALISKSLALVWGVGAVGYVTYRKQTTKTKATP